jgi:hypothetical protein
MKHLKKYLIKTVFLMAYLLIGIPAFGTDINNWSNFKSNYDGAGGNSTLNLTSGITFGEARCRLTLLGQI